MKLEGLTINILGDSITEGVGAGCTENRYTDVFAREFGVTVNNYGVSGSRIARQSEPDGLPHDRDFCMRMEEMDESADAVVVFGGTNDFGHGDAPIGTMDDRGVRTFYGACHTMMSYLMEHYCGKPVVIMTPLHRIEEEWTNGDGSGRKANNTAVLSEYRDILIETAQYYGFPVLDLYAVSGMQPRNPVSRERLMPDGLHPNDAGHAIIARRLGGFLQAL